MLPQRKAQAGMLVKQREPRLRVKGTAEALSPSIPCAGLRDSGWYHTSPSLDFPPVFKEQFTFASPSILGTIEISCCTL